MGGGPVSVMGNRFQNEMLLKEYNTGTLSKYMEQVCHKNCQQETFATEVTGRNQEKISKSILSTSNDN